MDFKEMKNKFDEFYPNYVNGEWVNSEGNQQMDVFCPANGEKLCSVAVASNQDVDNAVKAAQAAFPLWSALPLIKRYQAIMSVYQKIVENVDHLSVTESLETGRPLYMSKIFITSGMEQFPYFGGLLRTYEDGIISESPGVHSMVVREPVGVVGAICAWNLPLMLAFWKIAPALAAGNCVILKPSSYTPVGAMELVKLVDALLPPGVLNVVNGSGSTTGQYLLDHPGIDKLSFTGSTKVGISVGMAAAQRIIPATLELGGKSAGIYFADIDKNDLPSAIQGIVASCITNSGQICAMQSRVLVEEPLYDTLLEAVTKALADIKVGSPWQEDVRMGSVSCKGHMNDILEYISIGIKEGARLVQGGYQMKEGDLAEGYFIAPTVFADVDNSMRIAQEEIFGPVLTFIKFNGEEEAIQIANDSKYGLSGGVFTGDLRKGLRVAKAVRTGSMTINRVSGRMMGSSAFGGYKASGIGRECYKTTFDAFSQLKTINF